MRRTLHSCFCWCCLNHHQCRSLVLFHVCVCMQVTSVPSESHSSSPAEVTWAGYICVPTWSFLDLLGLVKGSNGRHTERALSTGAQLCLCALPSHSLFSLLSVYMCVCTGSWVGTVELGWPTWAGLLRSESAGGSNRIGEKCMNGAQMQKYRFSLNNLDCISSPPKHLQVIWRGFGTCEMRLGFPVKW